LTEQDLLKQLSENPESVQFLDAMSAIDTHYDFEPSSFVNGDLKNDAGQNNGSCKIFAFAKLHSLDVAQTLNLFGDYYRKDVLGHPEGSDHQNIRNFIQHEWAGLHFEQQALNQKQ